MVARKKEQELKVEKMCECEESCKCGDSLYGVAMAAMDKNLKEKRATRRHLEQFNTNADSFSSSSLQLTLPVPKRK